MPDMARRGIFGSLTSIVGQKKKETSPLRPPYVVSESLFHQECPSCEETPCVTVCEEAIIKIGEDHTPHLDFSKSGCTFCDECANACPKAVLVLDESKPLSIKAKVILSTKTCVAWNDVICSSCRDVCDERAIEFFGLTRPTVNEEKCTGCGFCYGVCPTYAIEIIARGEA